MDRRCQTNAKKWGNSNLEKLNTKNVDYFKLTNTFEYDLYELLSSFVYARAVNPCSKLRTFHEVLPCLFSTVSYSYDQFMDGLSFLENNYEKLVEIFTVQTKKETSCTAANPVDKFPYKVEHEGKELVINLYEKRLLTCNPSLASKKKYEINRMVEKASISINWDAIDKDLRFAGYNLQSIKGHFLICYLTVLLERLFQFKVLENRYSTSEIFHFIKDFKVTKAETIYINTATSSSFINELAERTGLPLTNYF